MKFAIPIYIVAFTLLVFGFITFAMDHQAGEASVCLATIALLWLDMVKRTPKG